jgi:preprotein translocase subunit SecD
MARKGGAQHAGRQVVVFLLGVAILYGLVALAGNWKPALGLDLQGGTRITLTAEDDPSSESLEEARQIIDARVNASGVAESEVTTQGGRFIVVEIPGENRRDLVDVVERQAQLRFRVVACSSIDPGPCGADPTQNPVQNPLDDLSPSGAPSESPSESPSASPDQESDGSAKNRPAFVAGERNNDKASESPSPTQTPSSPQSPTAEPSVGSGKDVSPAAEALAFQASPDQKSIEAYHAYTCPATEPVVDNPDEPLVTCGTGEYADVKFLLSPAAVEGTDLTDATAGVPQGGVGWQVNLSIGGEGEDVFADLSRQMVGTEKQFAIVLDGNVISFPGFDGVITNGDAQISGDFTEDEAKDLATSLKFGSLPIAFTDDTTSEDVGPSLAGNQLQAGLTAAALGLLLVMLYCLVYYRGLGLVVLASLLVSAAITFALVLLLAKTAGFTLTLPGIAGLIIGVGVIADSFVIFFERIRDEMREGRSMRVAVETGWKRARKTRVAANVVSLLSAAVLYIFATGVVKGFGFALGLSTLIDLAVLFWFTKPLVSYLARFRFFNGGGTLSGLSAGTLGIDRVNVEARA